jgi:hypothetical protein
VSTLKSCQSNLRDGRATGVTLTARFTLVDLLETFRALRRKHPPSEVF